MTPRKRSLLISGLVAGAALAAGALVSPTLSRRGDPVRDALADAKFVDLQGRSRSVSEWRGKLLVANFWATWCAPCLEEIPLLMAARRSRKDKGLEIVGIAIDLEPKVAQFATKMQIDYPILIAGADGLELIRTLGNRAGGLPFTVFLDRLGRPAQTKLGVLRQPELDTILAALMAG
jgi:thiol-disulfide isomerase/thioredoxin